MECYMFFLQQRTYFNSIADVTVCAARTITGRYFNLDSWWLQIKSESISLLLLTDIFMWLRQSDLVISDIGWLSNISRSICQSIDSVIAFPRIEPPWLKEEE